MAKSEKKMMPVTLKANFEVKLLENEAGDPVFLAN